MIIENCTKRIHQAYPSLQQFTAHDGIWFVPGNEHEIVVIIKEEMKKLLGIDGQVTIKYHYSKLADQSEVQ